MNKKVEDTQKVIKKTFTNLLLSKGFDGITVSEITREAGINRGTFYLHYLDKFDLLEKLELQVMDDLTKILNKSNTTIDNDNPVGLIPLDAITNALHYVNSDFDFFRALTLRGNDAHFVDRFKFIISNLIQERISRSDTLTFSMKGLPEDYAYELLLSSITSIVLLWIRKGSTESPEYITELINLSIQISPSELLR